MEDVNIEYFKFSSFPFPSYSRISKGFTPSKNKPNSKGDRILENYKWRKYVSGMLENPDKL